MENARGGILELRSIDAILYFFHLAHHLYAFIFETPRIYLWDKLFLQPLTCAYMAPVYKYAIIPKDIFSQKCIDLS